MISSGGAADGSPRTVLNAASCRSKDRLGLKNRNGPSTSQTRSAAWLVLAARLRNKDKVQAVARAAGRMHASRPHPQAIIEPGRASWRENSAPGSQFRIIPFAVELSH